jgi:hypothetical protein
MGMKKPLIVLTYTQIKNYGCIRPHTIADKSEYKGVWEPSTVQQVLLNWRLKMLAPMPIG